MPTELLRCSTGRRLRIRRQALRIGVHRPLEELQGPEAGPAQDHRRLGLALQSQSGQVQTRFPRAGFPEGRCSEPVLRDSDHRRNYYGPAYYHRCGWRDHRFFREFGGGEERRRLFIADQR